MSLFNFDPTDPDQGRVNNEILRALNTLGQFFSWGEGSPSHTPAGPQVYFEVDGPAVHVFDGSWTAL